MENKEEKAWSSTKSKQIHMVKNRFCLTEVTSAFGLHYLFSGL
jgi:hypothetical protein